MSYTDVDRYIECVNYWKHYAEEPLDDSFESLKFYMDNPMRIRESLAADYGWKNIDATWFCTRCLLKHTDKNDTQQYNTSKQEHINE